MSAQVPAPQNGDDGPLAVPVVKTEVPLDGPAGTYLLAAEMERGGSPAGNRLNFYVTDPASLPAVAGTVTLWGIDERTAVWLRGRGLRCRPFGAQEPTAREVILVGDRLEGATAADWRALATLMTRGCVAVFLSPAVFQRNDDSVGWLPLTNKGRCYALRNWLYHREDVAKPHPILAGLPAPGILDWEYYGPVIPHVVFEGLDLPDEIAVAYFATGYAPHPARTGYAAGMITATYPLGAGHFVLNSLRILDNIDQHPAADRLLLNMVTYAAGLVHEPLAAEPADLDATLSAIGYHP